MMSLVFAITLFFCFFGGGWGGGGGTLCHLAVQPYLEFEISGPLLVILAVDRDNMAVD